MSSFKKRVQTNQTKIPQGTRLSPYNGQLLISTGLYLDFYKIIFKHILGGGIPIGSVLLIKEDRHTEYARLLLKYFLVQGIVSGHHVLLSTAEEREPKNFIMGLPWLSNDTDDSVVDDDDKTTELEEKMTIAWRYKGLKKFESSVKNRIRNVIEENHLNSLLVPPSNVERNNAIRIGIHSIASPSWQSRSSHDIFAFLHALRGLLRFSFGAAVITIPAYLYTSSFSEPCSFIRRIEHMCDAVVEVESFAGSPATTNAIYSATYHGLFHVHKLPTLNSLIPSSTKLSVLSGGSGNNLGFKLRRKKFTIETFHLPPEGGINERRVGPETNKSVKKEEDDKSKPGIGSGCGTIPGRKVDPYDF
ncbi:7479_t:CDS:2 [Funneliformis mosseae]|uniref:Elongator complex protein 4 n=1 Tax=Funneliformis mosseae TaxID=27381 RepID=A0A9N9N8B3_FUNMO|nr:7479_t:CDS:2 [Funneliformis mosseae]